MITLPLNSRLQSRLGITPEYLAESCRQSRFLNWLCLVPSYAMISPLIVILMCWSPTTPLPSEDSLKKSEYRRNFHPSDRTLNYSERFSLS
jgi:hypothetical protein